MAKQFHNANFSDPYQESAFVTGLIYLPECVGEIMKMMPSNLAIQHENIRIVYDTICGLYQDGKEITEMAVRFEMIRSGNKPALDRSTMTLQFDAHTPADVESLYASCEGIISMYRRQITYNLTIQLNAKLEGNFSDHDLSESVNSVYQALTMNGGHTAEKTSKQAAKGALEKMDKARKLYQSKGMSGIPTGSNKLDRELGGWQNDEVIILAGRPAMGKCLGKGTKVVMFDGSLKKVEDVVVGDRLIGPDSKPKTVTSLARGVEEMYWVRQVKGMDYRVNGSHVLSLKRSRREGGHTKGTILNISVNDYIEKSGKFKTNYKGYKSGVEFPDRPTEIEPYYLGVWLGDGTTNKGDCVTNPDSEIIEYLGEYAERLGLDFKSHTHTKRCPTWSISCGLGTKRRHLSLSGLMKRIGLTGDKHIPENFLINSREKRLELLAGLLDTDGGLNEHKNGFNITQKKESLLRQIKFLCDSLGLGNKMTSHIAEIKSTGYKCRVYNLSIYGDLENIPTKVKRKQAEPRRINKDWTVNGIKIEPDGKGEYFGFTLDGDGLFLLEDFTVTHNTSAALDFVLSAAKAGHPVGFFSMEMDSEDLNFRLASIETAIPYNKMIKGWTTDEEWIRIETALSQIAELPIFYYDDVSVQNVHKMAIVAKEWCRTRGIKLIFIDYIQYLQANDKFGSSTEQISAVSRAVKSLQRALKIPIIAMAQLGRQVDSRPDPRPRKEDLKESGQLEQDASTIIGLFYPEEYERIGRIQYDENRGKEEKFEENAYCLYLLKRRSGGYARIDRFCDLATCRFSDTNIFKPDPQAQIQFSTNKVLDQIPSSFEKTIPDVKQAAQSELPF